MSHNLRVTYFRRCDERGSELSCTMRFVCIRTRRNVYSQEAGAVTYMSNNLSKELRRVPQYKDKREYENLLKCGNALKAMVVKLEL